MGVYTVECLKCGKTISGYSLSCKCTSLIRAKYKNPLTLRNLPGMWRFLDWLPCEKPIVTTPGPITYRSENLGKELGLKNLYITFTGYWPERKAFNMTCSFKDLEASPTISRAMDNNLKTMIIASAGNTGRAFAHVSNKTGFPIYLVVPEFGIKNVWTSEEPGENIRLISVKGDYFDAIYLSQRISEEKSIIPEGGTKNIARRDGMGTVMLSTATTIGRIPDHYFQAVGSGPGAIGSWEMAHRLKNQGYKGWPKLHLSQNAPFTPIVNAWNAKRKQILPDDMPNAKESIKQIYAKVLSNRKPPYSITGGVYDALKDTAGRTYAVTNQEAIQSKKLFEALEGIDLLPAPCVAVASLIKAIDNHIVGPNDDILLNITGGGEKILKEEVGVHRIKPSVTVSNPDVNLEEII